MSPMTIKKHIIKLRISKLYVYYLVSNVCISSYGCCHSCFSFLIKSYYNESLLKKRGGGYFIGPMIELRDSTMLVLKFSSCLYISPPYCLIFSQANFSLCFWSIAFLLWWCSYNHILRRYYTDMADKSIYIPNDDTQNFSLL